LKSPANFRLEGLNLEVDLLKQAMEHACPNTVSCADILSFAARDGVALSGGPCWTIKGGRVSTESDTTLNLPGPDMHVAQLTKKTWGIYPAHTS